MSDLRIKVVLEAIDRISSVVKTMSDRFKSSVESMQKKIKSFGDAMTDVGSKISMGISAPITALGGLAISKSIQFEKLGASLETVTGSVDKASKAMKELIKFSATTPFQLEEVVGSFIKLKALGLEPSMEAMKAYGNVSSAMGKSLDQFIEAIADATTGEFERLKEFGIKASSEGKKVAFTFQGQTKVVGKNSKEIEAYLRSIGQVQFAGAMDRQMNTLGGSISNLQDAISTSMAQIGQSLSSTFGLKDKIASMAGVIVRLSEAFASLPEPMRNMIGYGALFLAILGPLLMVLGQVVIGFGALMMAFTLMGPPIMTFLALLKALSIGLFTTPIGWFVLGLTAIAVAGYMLVKNWEKIKGFFGRIWEGIKATFKEGVEAVLNWLQPLLNAIDSVKNGIGRVMGGSASITSPAASAVTVASYQSQRVDTGGTLKIKVDTEGRARVLEAQSNNPKQKLSVDTGYVMGGAY